MPQDVVETASRFVEYINRQKMEKLAEMMTEEHRFVDPSGDAYVGRGLMEEGWADYFQMCPDYIIHVSDFHQQGNRVFLMGQTTGSHLDLPWREEFRDKVIWTANIERQQLAQWKIVADTPDVRRAYGIPDLNREACR